MRPKTTLLFLLLLTLLAPGARGDGKDNEAARAAELARLRQQIKAVQDELEQTRGQRNQAEIQLRVAERQIGSALKELRLLQGKLRRAQRRLNGLRGDQRRQHDALNIQTARLGDQVRSAYLSGRQAYLKMLLNQEEPAAMGRTLAYYQYLNRARLEEIDKVRDGLARLARLENDIGQQTRQLEQLHRNQLDQKNQLETLRDQRRELLASLDRRVQSQHQHLGNLRQNERDLERLLERLRGYLADIPDAPSFKVRFSQHRRRMQLPISGRLRATYGSPRHEGKLRWKGMFIAAPEGRSVHAVFRGRVAYADWLRGFGLLLIIEHGDGYMSLYGHNQSLYKEVGEWVETGEVVASTGSTGDSDIPGLYFEIRHQGQPQDPQRWCVARR